MPKDATVPSRSERGTAPSLFSPDIILPSQYYDRLAQWKRLTPEKKLQIAVLGSAVYDMQRYCNARSARERRLFREASDWFTVEDDTEPFSFLAICHALELDPAYIRNGIVSSAQGTQAK